MTIVTKGMAPGTGATVGYSNPASRVNRAIDGVPESELITVNLNGREVKARKGETIMEVCHREDIYVPHYCWHPSLSIAGNCRLCLVEVEKTPKPQIGCQTHVAPGMVIRTQSEQAKSAQKWMMEFLLVNHPLDCPVCDRGGECQLQRYSMDYGDGHARMADKKRKFIKPQADPLIDIERNRCIMCTRCVRFSDEVGGEHVMGVFDRGDGNYIGTFGQGPVSNVFSGNVIDLCPVGCLTNKPNRFRARAWELKQTQSTCDLCSSGCKTTHWTRNEKHYRTTPPSRLILDRYTINEDTEEFICNQGRFGSDYGQHESREAESMTRKVGRLVPTKFEEAIETAAAKLRATIEKHGPSSVAVLVSPRATLEEGQLARDLARNVIRTPNVDWRAGYANTAAANAVSAALSAATGDFENDPDVILVLNGKLVWQSPIVAMRVQEYARRFGKTVIMVGHYHDSYIAEFAKNRFHVKSTGEALGSLAKGDMSSPVSAILPVLRDAKRGLIVHGLEEIGGLSAASEVPAAAALARQLGWGYLPVVRERNAVGLHALNVEPGAGGVAAPDLAAAMQDGRIKGLFVLGADALAAMPDRAGVTAGLAQLETLVVADHFRSEFSERAEVFLALATNLERFGTYADIEGNLAMMKAAHAPAGDSRAWIGALTGLGRALGDSTFGTVDIHEAFRRVRAELAPSSTFEFVGLELEGSTNDAQYVQLRPEGGARNRGPEDNPGNYRKDGLHLRGSNSAALPAAASAVGAAKSGFTVLWGPHVSGRGYLTDRGSQAAILAPKPFVEIHPTDAKRLGARDGQFAVLTSNGARAKVGIRISDSPAPGILYVPAGTHGAFDAASLGASAGAELELLNEQVPDQGEALTAVGTM